MSAANLRRIAEGTYVDVREVVAVQIHSGDSSGVTAFCTVEIHLTGGSRLRFERAAEGLETWLRTTLDARGIRE